MKFLNIIKTASEIAETAMIARALLGGLMRVVAPRAAVTGSKKVAVANAKNHSPMAYYPTNYQSPPGVKFRPEFEKTLDIVNRTPVTGSGMGSAINRQDLAIRQQISGWHEDFEARAKELMVKKGDNLGGWILSKEEFAMLDKEVSAKWGDIWALYQ